MTEELRSECCLSDATWAQLQELGFSLQQRLDLIGTVGQYTLACFMLNSFGVQLEEDLITIPQNITFRPDVRATRQ